MSEFNDFDESSYIVSDVIVNKKPELSLIWLLPLCALLVSAWLIYKAASEKGSVITINFPTAEGLEVDKTKIKYLDVEIGKVIAININEDLKTIAVSAQMNSDAARYLRKNTRFWVVRPQVGLGGISGLNTLLSGAYIAIKPGNGEKERYFTGLSTPPLLKTNAEGKHFILETSNLGSIRPGTPINFHGIIVGEVLSHKLSTEANAIRLSVFIDAPYDQFIRKHTRFWVDSGVDLSASADGFKIKTGPLISLLSGGIAFRTASNDSVADVEAENSLFSLYDNYEQSTQIVYNNTLQYVMYFNGSVRGLTENAPVQLRGIPIGKVTNIGLELDKKSAEIRVPVSVELQPERIKTINNLPNVSDQDIMTQLIHKGLRAQLQTGSLLTGQLLIDLDFYPKSKTPLLVTANNDKKAIPEFPTVTSSIDEFSHSAQTIMDKIAKLPLEDLTNQAHTTLQTLQGTSNAATTLLTTANGSLGHADKAINSADKALQSAQQVLSTLESGSTIHYELEKLLQELTQTASSVKQLTDYLQQHPDTVIRGKTEKSD